MRGGGPVMRDPQGRLALLEARMQGVWPADVEAAKRRVLARVRLKISLALGVVDDPAFAVDHALLTDDSAEQAAADREILQRWARQHPATLYPEDGARERITAKLEAMGRGLEASHES
jgi:hypothetical protein